jgi:Uma2 family endonuclease
MSNLIAIAEDIAAVPIHRWTLADYHAMIEAGVLNSSHRVELLFGKIVDMNPVGRAHAQTVKKLNRLFSTALDHDKYVLGVQDPITILENSEPEPDLFVANGPFEKYNDHHPYADDLVLLIEVADSTLKSDRGIKSTSYALAGIQEYWIIDVYGRQIVQRTAPDQTTGIFNTEETFQEGETISSMSLGDFLVDDLLVRYDD